VPIIKKAILVLFIIILIISFAYKGQFDFKQLEKIITQAGYWAPILFMACYFMATIMMLPVVLLTLASGALFGPYWGTVYTLISATIAATVSLLIGRFFAREMVAKISGKMLTKIINGVNAEGWHFVAFVRLVPLFPFVIVNYAFGLTNIKILPYTITNFICMLPACFAYSYLGFLGKSATTDNSKQLIGKIFIAIAVFASTIFIAKVLKRRHDNIKKLKV